MASADILRAARARIEDPKNWTKNVLARDTRGREVPADDPRACRWCAYGALIAEGKSITSDEGHLLRVASRSAFNIGVPCVNDDDDKGHPAIIQVFDAAIAAAEAEAGR